jgi:hypothetical protein
MLSDFAQTRRRLVDLAIGVALCLTNERHNSGKDAECAKWKGRTKITPHPFRAQHVNHLLVTMLKSQVKNSAAPANQLRGVGAALEAIRIGTYCAILRLT